MASSRRRASWLGAMAAIEWARMTSSCRRSILAIEHLFGYWASRASVGAIRGLRPKQAGATTATAERSRAAVAFHDASTPTWGLVQGVTYPLQGTSPLSHGPDAKADSAQAYASAHVSTHGSGRATSKVATSPLTE